MPLHAYVLVIVFFQAEDGIRDLVRSRGLGDVYKRQLVGIAATGVTFRNVLNSAQSFASRREASH